MRALSRSETFGSDRFPRFLPSQDKTMHTSSKRPFSAKSIGEPRQKEMTSENSIHIVYSPYCSTSDNRIIRANFILKKLQRLFKDHASQDGMIREADFRAICYLVGVKPLSAQAPFQTADMDFDTFFRRLANAAAASMLEIDNSMRDSITAHLHTPARRVVTDAADISLGTAAARRTTQLRYLAHGRQERQRGLLSRPASAGALWPSPV